MNKAAHNLESIFWDFDGVILDSMSIRDKGFELTLTNFPSKQVEALLTYHRRNGGLSRYNKFRYFFEVIRGEPVSDGKIQTLADKFSSIMIKELSNPELLIQDTLNFISQNYLNLPMNIVSGSDQKELRQLCRQLKIEHYFKSIYGSPTEKKVLVINILKECNYEPSKCILIGDSINDYEAAKNAGVTFIGYNNPLLISKVERYIRSFELEGKLLIEPY